MTGDEPVPWPAVLALMTGALSALPLAFTTVVTGALAGEIDGGPVLASALLVLTVAFGAGVVLLRGRRSWRVLVGASLAVLLVLPVAAVVTSEGSESVVETVGSLGVLLAGPLATGLLASAPGSRRWGSPPSRLPADRQPGPGSAP